MSAHIISVRDSSHQGKLAVSFRLLLGLYLIIPVCLMLQWLDSWFWQNYLRENLPSSPSHFLLFQLLFGTPHIVASAIILASNTEYLKLYQRNIIIMTAALAVVFGLGSLFIPYRVLYIAVACWTVFHVLKQQHGIGRGICRLPEWAFQLLLWLSVAAGILIYLGIFLKNSLDAQQVTWIKQSVAVLCVALTICALLSQRYVPSTFAKWFLWANVFLVISSFYLFAQRYYFLAILVPRLVHDATAYIFYVMHDYNKHHQQPKNFIYRYAGRCPCACLYRAAFMFVFPGVCVAGLWRRMGQQLNPLVFWLRDP